MIDLIIVIIVVIIGINLLLDCMSRKTNQLIAEAANTID